MDTDSTSSTSSSGGSGGGGGGGNDCQVTGFSDSDGHPSTLTVDCSDSDGWLSDNCRYSLDRAPQAPPAGATTGAWYVKKCYARHSYWEDNPNYVALGPAASVWLPTPPPGMPIDKGTTLVDEAIATTNFAIPSGYRAPTLIANGNSTVVNAHTWYWIAPVTTITKRVQAKAAWMEMTATPTFTLDPGDGTGTFTCPGTGTVPLPHTNFMNATSTCEHIYRKTSLNSPGNKFTATYTLRWAITYTAWDTPNATALPTILRQSTDTFPVQEIQNLVVPLPTP